MRPEAWPIMGGIEDGGRFRVSGRLFNSGKVSPEKRLEILAYLRSEFELDVMHREQGERYQRLTTPLKANAPGTDAARAMAEAVSTLAVEAHQLVQQHAELEPVPEEARDSHVASHLAYVALANWLDASAAGLSDVADGASATALEGVPQLRQEQMRLAERAREAQTALMTRALRSISTGS